MNDQIESAVESPEFEYVAQLGPKTAVVVFSLATYGGVDLTRKAVTKAKQLRANRQAKKAEEKAVAANNPPSEQ